MRMRQSKAHEYAAVAGPAHWTRSRSAGYVVAACLVATTVTAGCASLFQVPDVSIASVRVAGIGLRGGTLEAGLLVSNPNGYALRSGLVRYQLELAEPGGAAGQAWIPLATGELEREVIVAARDSVIVAIPIDFTWDAVGSAIRSLLERGTFDYRVSGALELQSPIRRTVPYRRTGTLSVGA